MSKHNNNRSALQMSGFRMREQGVSKRVKNITISAIKEMMLLSQKIDGVVSLAQGTPDFETPANVKAGIKKEIDTNHKVGKYGSPFNGIKKLRQEIAKKLASKRGIKADPKSEIYVTAGAMEAVVTAILTVVDQGDEVLLLTPCFPSYFSHVSLAGGSAVSVPLHKDNGWSLDMQELKNRITDKTKAVVVCSPNNPTGSVYKQESMEELARLARSHDFWIITDEPYDFLIYDENKFFSINQISGIKDRLIACFSFSKEYAMSGYRIGYVYAAADVVNQMLKIHDAFTVSTTTISQYAAVYALQGDQSCVKDFKHGFAKRRDLICARLDKLKDLFSYQKPSGAYYVFAKIENNADDFNLALDILKQARVVVVPGSSFGPNGKGYIRFCFAMSEIDINEAFDRIERWWKQNENKFK